MEPLTLVGLERAHLTVDRRNARLARRDRLLELPLLMLQHLDFMLDRERFPFGFVRELRGCRSRLGIRHGAILGCLLLDGLCRRRRRLRRLLGLLTLGRRQEPQRGFIRPEIGVDPLERRREFLL